MGFRDHHDRKGKNVEFNDVEGVGGWVDLCNSQERALGMAFLMYNVDVEQTHTI